MSEEGAKEERKERRRVRAEAGGSSAGGGGDGGGYDPTSRSKSSKQRSSASVSGSGAGDQPVFSLMYTVHDRLVLLDYERAFCQAYSLRPFAPAFLAVDGGNALDQFSYFASLCHWLAGLCGKKFERPDPYRDDPAAVLTSLLRELRDLSALGIDAHPPATLKSGHGSAVLAVVGKLAEMALEASHFGFSSMEQPMGGEDDGEELEGGDDDLNDTGAIEDEAGESGGLLSGIQDDVGDEETDSESEDDMLGGIGGGPGGIGGVGGAAGDDPAAAAAAQQQAQSKKILESKVNPAAWKLELERVAPLLKVTVQGDLREWRTRLESMGTFLSFVAEQFPASQSSLERIRGDVRQVLDKLSSREKYLNTQLEHQLSDYRVVQERLQDLNEKHRVESDRVNDATSELNSLTEELEAIKDQMHDSGTSMTDTSPIVKIKTAIAQIKTDIQQMEVRIHIMQSNLLHARMGASG